MSFRSKLLRASPLVGKLSPLSATRELACNSTTQTVLNDYGCLAEAKGDRIDVAVVKA